MNVSFKTLSWISKYGQNGIKDSWKIKRQNVCLFYSVHVSVSFICENHFERQTFEDRTFLLNKGKLCWFITCIKAKLELQLGLLG